MTSDAISQETQKLSTDNLVELFQIDATAIGGSVYHFTSSAYTGSTITFDSVTYTPIDFEAEGFEWSGAGTLPTPKIRISNATKVVEAAVISFGDLVGATLTRIRTFKQFLDDGENPDPTAIFPKDIYIVDRKSAHNKVFIEWELAAAMDQQGKKLPGRQFLKNACTHIYRRWDSNTSSFDYSKATCPYTSTVYYDKTDKNVPDQSNDVCGKRLTSCRLRFGENAELPTWAFPGIGDTF